MACLLAWMNIWAATVCQGADVIVASEQPTLAWNNLLSSKVAGFYVRYGVLGGTVTNTLNASTATSVVLNGLAVNQTNFVFVTTYNSSGAVVTDSSVLYYYPTSAVATVIAPSIITQPSSATVVQGASANLSVVTTGTSPLTCQWYKNGSAVSGATNMTYALSSAQASDAGTYYVVVSNASGSVTSSNVTLAVNVPPTITGQPVNAATVLGSTAAFTVSATGSAPFSYQWYKSGLLINGANGATLTLNNVQASDAATYFVLVGNVAGGVTSSNATLTVNVPPTITAQPANATAVLGSNVVFSVSATGTAPFTYQWYKGATAINGATSSTLTLNSVQVSSAGSYSVVVGNLAGSATSGSATLTVNVPPTITAQPASVAAVQGTNVTFSVTASGTAPFTYQWYKGSSLLSGATNAALTLTGVQPADAANYSVTVANMAGSVPSASATLTVNVPPTIAAQPANVIAVQGTNASFTVAATGTTPMSYQWYKGAAQISGATSATLTLNNVQSADAGSYSVTVSNAASTVASGAAALVVNVPPTISTQPSSVIAVLGTNLSFSVVATGTMPLGYQWYRGSTAISGATSATLTLNNVQVADAGTYSAVVSNVAATVASSGATLTVNVPPAITSQPANVVAVQSSNVTFTVAATGTTPLSYQWLKDGVAIGGATSASLSLLYVQTTDAGAYSVIVSNAAGILASGQATLTVNVPPTIAAQPVNAVLAQGENASFTVAASGTPPLSYQWRKNGIAISGATGVTLALSKVQSADEGSYSVYVSNAAGNVTSASATLTVNNAPMILTQPASAVAAEGSNVTFAVAASGAAPLAYQWFKDNAAIPGATNAALALLAVQSDDEGAYQVQVSNMAGNVASDSATLLVHNSPSITVQPLDVIAAQGSNVVLSVTAGGAAPLYYQWFKNSAPVAQGTNASLNFASVQTANEGAYLVVVSNMVGAVTSVVAQLTVNLPPAITSQPAGLVASQGSSAWLSVTATGTAPLSYQWFKDGQPLSGATNATLVFNNAQAADEGSYAVTVANAVSTVGSASATLAVIVGPEISSQPASVAAVQGTNVTFAVVASGTAPLSYQWSKDGAAIAGATGPALAINSVKATDAGWYAVTVANAAGSLASSGASLVVNAPVTITTQPAGLVAAQGSNVNFTVAATGTAPITYQWYKDGVALGGATSATLSLNNVQASDAGVYTVQVSNFAGSVPSAGASLAVNLPPTITAQPAGVTAVQGTNVAFSVEATGTAPLTYQWSKDGSAISKATNATLVLSDVQAVDAAVYIVTVANAAGFVASLPATLTVNAVPMLTSQPASVIAVKDTNVTFTVAAVGTAPLSYQWYKNGGAISGANSATLALLNVQTADMGNYSVEVSNLVGKVSSGLATLTVNLPPAITSQPANMVCAQGANVNLSVAATGTAPLSYQWYKNGVAIAGATGASLALNNVQSSHEGAYTVVVSNPAGSIPSSAATLVVNNAPTISVQPASMAVAKGGAAYFNVVAGGAAPLTYQWFKDGVAIGGATSSLLSIASAQTANAGAYAVIVSNSVSSVASAVATLTVNDAPTITAQPKDVVALQGGNALMTVTAGGAAPLNYQWFKNGVAVNGATSPTLALSSVQESQSGDYYVVVNNPAGTATSSSAKLTVNVAAAISAQPAGAVAIQGANVNFSVNATGTAPLSYQWFKNGVAISGATNASLALVKVQSADNGTYAVEVSNVAGTAISANASLVVNVPPSLTTQPAGLAIAAGSSATFSVVAAGTAPLSYQWYKNGAVIAGATSPAFTLSGTTANDAGSYSLVVSNVAGMATSASAVLVVNSAPVITAQPASQVVVLGASASFAATVSGTAPITYQWYKNDIALSGATSATLTLNNVKTNDAGNYTLTASNAAGTATTKQASLTVNSGPVFATQPASVTVAQGSNVTFKAVVSGTAPLAYQWFKDDVAIGGATSATLSFSSVQAAHAGTYTLVVSNAAGAVASTPAVLVVNSAPVITAQPVSLAVAQGSNATFSVAALGTAPMSYQWYKNGVALGGATSAQLVLSNAQASEAAAYKVVVSNVAGLVTSASVALAVLYAPEITSQPSGLAVNPGANATFRVTVSGAAPFTYQWFQNGVAIAGATGQSLYLAKVQGTNAGAYSVTVSNSVGGVVSATAALTINTPPSIATQPQNLIAVLTSNATFSVLAAGTDPLRYQWRLNGAKIKGATNAAYTIANVQLTNEASYSVVITNIAGSITSSVAALTVIVPPAFTTQPANMALALGSNGAFTAAATGTAPIAWQWQKNGVNLPGATNRNLTITTAKFADAGDYQVVASNAAGQATSAAANLFVGIAPAIAQSPASASVVLGSNATLNVTATGTGPLTYQWLKDGMVMDGETNTFLTFASAKAGDAASYSVIAANLVGNATSDGAALTVLIPPTIISQPASVSTRQGSNVTFTVNASGTAPMTYQWLRNGANIAGATNKTYTIGAVQWADANNSFSVVVANAAGQVTSAAAMLTLNGPPAIIDQPQNAQVTVGSAATFSVNASGTAPMTYRWSKNGVTIPNATNAVYVITNVQSSAEGSYVVRIQNALGSTNSVAATLTIVAGLPTVDFALRIQGQEISSLSVTGGLAPVLTWNLAPAPYTGYFVYLGTVDDVTNRFDLGNTNLVQLTGLFPGSTYYVRVVAYTATNGLSNPSDTLAYTPVFAGPSALLVNGQVASSQVVAGTANPAIAWTASSEPTTAGYYVYYGPVGGESLRVDAGLATSLTLTNLAAGVTNSIYVVAYNSAGLESDPAGNGYFRLQTQSSETASPMLTVMQTPTANSPASFKIATVPGVNYTVQVSENLRDWSDVATLHPATSTEAEYTDVDSVNHRIRFYRTIIE